MPSGTASSSHGTHRGESRLFRLPPKDEAEQRQSPAVQHPSGTGDFASRLYEKLAETEPDKNLIFSPFSIQVALAMCAVGARGETRDVLADLIEAPRSIDEQNRQYAALLKSVNGKDRPFELVTANALWGHQGYHFKPDFKKTLADFYNGNFEAVDFVARPTEAMNRVNNWASDRTHAKIKELIQRQDIKDHTRLILTNAIYFKGKWEKEFNQANTRDEEWHGRSRTNKVPMMHQTGDFLYYEDTCLQAIEPLFQNGSVDRGLLSMLVVLPKKVDGVEVPAQSIYKKIKALLKQGLGTPQTEEMEACERVVVSLPRFKTETTSRLKPVLCSLGAGLAFSDSADFSGIGAEPLKISEVVHKASVEVSEEGTEAAAATAVEMPLAGCPPPMFMPEPKIFNADHPFLFFIRDRNTNTVLFAGQVVEPK